MPVIARQSGAKLVILNLTPTPHDGYADVVIAEKTGETMAKIVDRVKKKTGAK
jgi:NAD-dependent SIR2 family protein deacetylase